MGGDEIVADWLGDVYSSSITTSSTVQHLSAASLRFRTAVLYAGNTTLIGKYNSNATTFNAYSIFVTTGSYLELKYVDLYELGCTESGGPTASTLRILGINEY